MEIEHSDGRSGIATGGWPGYPNILDANGDASREHPGEQQQYVQARLECPASIRDRGRSWLRHRAG